MPLAQRRKLCGTAISMIFQEPMTSLNPVFTIGFQISEVLRLHKGMNAGQAREKTIALLDEVGIPSPQSRIDAYPGQLSGGQQQRVMIAMAIACEPKLLIADEPTTALDVTIQKQVIDLLHRLRSKYGMSILFITHDLALVGDIADQVVVMRDGAVVEAASTQDIFRRPQHAYTKALLHCRPRLDCKPHRLPVIDDYMDGLAPQSPAIPAAAPIAAASQAKTDIVLEVRHLSKSFFSRSGLFGRRELRAVSDVSFTLARGKTLGVVGESGSGKSTLGLSLLCLHRPTSGQVLFAGKDILSMREQEFYPYKRRLQIIFQNPYASLNPRFTVAQILLEPMRIHRIGVNDGQRMSMAMQLLDRVGLPSAALHRYAHEFSGGQRQRIAIARCLTMRPEVLVCDESVSALDVSVQAQVLNLLRDLQDEFGLSYIFISHDLAVVKYIADDVIVMHEGQVVEQADAATLYSSPSHGYTRQLLSAIPQGLSGIDS